jgi:hypothetical protein
MQLLAQIASENKAADNAMLTWTTPKSTQLKTVGAARALAVFQAEQKAQAEVLAQLRAMKLGAES